MEKNKIKSNILINLGFTFAVGILGFILNKYFSEYIGMQNLGLMKLFTQFIGYFNLIDLGIGSAAAYSLYKPLVENDKNKIEMVFSTVDYFFKRVAIIIIILGLSFNIILEKFIKNELSNYDLNIYWSLYVINTGFSYLFAKYSILFLANQEFRIVKGIQGIGKIIFQLLQIVLIMKYKSFLLYILVFSLENIYLYICYKWYFLKKYKIHRVNKRDKIIVKNIKNIFWHRIAEVVVFNTDYIILTKFTSLITIGIYSSYLMVYQIILGLIGIVSNVLTPYIGKFVINKSKEEIYLKWLKINICYYYISTVLIICTYYLINPFVKLWIGEKYILSNLTTLYILINLFIHMTRGPLEIFKNAGGLFEDIHLPVYETFLNLIFSLILVQKYKLNGVICGTIISNIVIIFFMKPIYVFKNYFKKNKKDYIKLVMKLLILLGINCKIIDFFIEKYLLINGIEKWEELIIRGIIIGTITLGIVTLTFLTHKTFREMILGGRYGTKKYKNISDNSSI